MPLTNTQCDNAKPKDKTYKLSDGQGMFLEIRPNGSKYWRMNYRYQNKQKTLALGVYPDVSLKRAREKRDDARKLLSEGIDPSKHKKKQILEAIKKADNTFKAVALEWHETQKERWSEKHYQSVLNRLEKDLFPYIGDNLIHEIEPPELIAALKEIEKRGALDLLKRSRQIAGQVFGYAIANGKCTRNPVNDLNMTGLFSTRKTQHFAAIDTKDIPELLEAIERNDARLYAQTRRALKLSMLVFLRPGELRKGTWDEIDLDEKIWLIPGEKMKMGRDHIVPLSAQAIDILKEQREDTKHLKSDWIFPSIVKPKNPISDGTVNVALKKLGFEGRMNAHGFRALARTAIREKLNYEPDVIECQLAHKAAGPLGEAYNRAQFLDQRKTMMQDWANYLDALQSDGKVIQGNFKKQRA